MELPDSLLTLYTGKVVEKDGSHYVEIPQSETENTPLSAGDVVKVGIMNTGPSKNETFTEPTEGEATDRFSNNDSHTQNDQTPPVEEGDQLTVTVEDLGKKGDGIARVDGSFVIIVPDAKPQDTVDVKVTDVKDTFAVAEPVEFKEPVSAQQ